jgi:hypothetical protein
MRINKIVSLAMVAIMVAIAVLTLGMFFLSPMQAMAATPKDGLLSQDLLLDDGFFYAVDDTVAADADDVFVESSMTEDTSKVWLPDGARVHLPKNLDVDLAQSQLRSSASYYDSSVSRSWHKLGGSDLFMNDSANLPLRSGNTITATTNLTFSGDYGECLATGGTMSADQNVNWTTQLEEDKDGDGITDETGDEEWLTSFNGDEFWYLHFAMKSDAGSTSTDNWASVALSFKTTGSSNYDINIKMYEYGGDTDTTVAAISNGMQMDFFSLGAGTSYDHLILTFDMAKVLADDSEGPNIVGLDYIISTINIDSESDDKYIGLRIYNICAYTSYPGITDNINDDGTIDYDTSGIMGGFDGDCDIPNSAITDNAGATDDTYDNLLDLEHELYFYDGSIETLQARFRKIYFVSDGSNEVEIEPSKMSNTNVGGSANWNADVKGYLVQSIFEYDLTWMDWGGTPTTYFSWTASSSKVMFEWKVDYDVMAYKCYAESDAQYAIYRDGSTLNGWVMDNTDQTAELISAFDGQADAAVLTDIVLNEPNQDWGAKIAGKLCLYMRTPVSADGSLIVGGGEEDEGQGFWDDPLAWVFAAGATILGAVTFGKLGKKHNLR